MRLRPSKRNGFVTIPTVSAPASRASSQTTGAAPVPVPPPMPQVTKTRSALHSTRDISSRLSSIAWRPISGRAPAPSPRVSFLPIWILCLALASLRAWASVLIAMNSTPSRSSSIMRLTALLPPPPTPITFILAFCCRLSSNSKIILPPRAMLLVATVLWCELLLGCLKEFLQPRQHLPRRSGAEAAGAAVEHTCAEVHQAGGRGELGLADGVGEADEAFTGHAD